MDITLPSAVDVPAPIDAASNIKSALMFNLNADHYASDLKPTLSPLAKQSESNNDVTPTVAKYASQSTQHLSLIQGRGPVIGRVAEDVSDPIMTKEDPQKHSFMENQMNFIAGQMKHGWEGDQRTTDQTLDKIFNPNQWNADKETNLQISKFRDQQNTPSNYGLTDNEQIVGHVLGGAASMISDLWNNTGAVGVGAVGGAAVGFGLKGTTGVLPGALIGAFDAPFAYSTFKNTTASVYNNLSDSVDNSGAPLNIDETTKKYTALGVGVVNAAVQAGVGYVVGTALPGAGKLIAPNTVRAILTDPSQKVLKSALFKVGEAMTAGGLGSSTQTAITTFATAFAKNYDGTAKGLDNALSIATAELKKSAPQVVRSGIEGGLTTGLVAGAFAGTHVLLPKAAEPTPLDRARQAAQVGAAIDNIHKVSTSTTIHEVAPNELVALQKSMADDAGAKNVYINPVDLQAKTNTPDKLAKARAWLSPRGTGDQTPISIPMHTFLGLVRDLPDIKDVARVTPDGPSIGEANKFILNERKVKAESIPLPEPIKAEEEVKLHQMDQVLNPADEIQKTNSTKALQDDQYTNPNIQIADNFKGNPTEKGAESHEKKGFSYLAIDPRSLPAELAHLANDPQLKEQGVFVKGGISADAAASLLGFDDGETLLKTLGSTPTREQLDVKATTEAAQTEAAVAPKVNLENLPSNKALAEIAKSHLNEQSRLKAVKTETAPGEPTVSIELPVPSYESIQAEARTQIGETPISELNPKQHQVGERNASKVAVEAEPKGQLLNAFNAREQAARSAELARQAKIATGKVNRVVNLVTKFTPNVMEQLKQVDKVAHDAVNEILAKTLDPSKESAVKDGAFDKYIEKTQANGGITGPMPEAVRDLPPTFNEMTVDQVLTIGDSLKGILKNVENKDYFLQNLDGVEPGTRASEVMGQLAAQLKTHPLYDTSKIEQKVYNPAGKFDWISRYYSNAEGVILQAQHILTDLDRGLPNGPMKENIFGRIRNAKFEENKLIKETMNHFRDIKKQFGKKRFDNMANNVITIPELAGKQFFDKKGRVAESTLFAWELNWGNEGNLKVWDEYGLSRELGRQILDKYLTDDHTKLAENMRNVYKSFYDKAQDLQMRTEGTNFEPVQAVPYAARGKEVSGGYYPIFRVTDDVTNARRAVVGVSEVSSLDKLKQNTLQGAQALTEQGHLESRVGGNGLLDDDLNRYAFSLHQVVHDLTMREAVRDTAKILADRDIAEGIKAVRSAQAYQVMTNWLIDAAGKVDRNGYNKTEVLAQRVLNHLGIGMRLQYVFLKAGAPLKALSVVPQTLQAMSRGGNKSAYHMAAAIVKTLARPNVSQNFEFAREIDPSIGNFADKIVGKASDNIASLMPSKNNKVTDVALWGRKIFTNMGMAATSGFHTSIKALTALSAYHQAMSGDAKGIEAGDYKAAVDYARGISENTQYQNEDLYISEMQKNKTLAPILSYFMNDANNATNNTLLAARLAKAKFAESGDAFDKGKYGAVVGAAAAGVGGLVSQSLFIMAARSMYLNLANEASKAVTAKLSDDDYEFEDDPDESAAGHVTKAVGEDFLGGIPVIRDVLHSVMYSNEDRPVEFKTPVTDMMKDFANGTRGVAHGLKLFTDNDVTPDEAKSMLYSTGYITHLPVDALYKYLGRPDLTDNDLPPVRVGDLAVVGAAIANWTKKQEEAPTVTDDEFKEALKVYQQQYVPEPKPVEPPPTAPIPGGAVSTADFEKKTGIPADFSSILIEAESRGDANAKNPKKGNTAIGLGQFTQDTWNDLRDKHPTLKLSEMTDEMVKNKKAPPVAEQERAIAQFTKDNAETLKRAKLNVSVENLYILHGLGNGHNRAIKVIESPDNMKMRNVPGIGRGILVSGGNKEWFKQGENTTVGQYKANIKTFLAKVSPTYKENYVDKSND